MSMAGQWISRYQGSNSGTLVVNIEENGDHYKGVACAWDDNPHLPSSLVRFVTPSKHPTQVLDGVKIVPMWRTGRFLTSDEISSLSKIGVSFPSDAHISFDFQGSQLSIAWNTSIKSAGATTAVLSKTSGGTASALVPLRISTWGRFKKYIDTLPAHRYVFRGQEYSKWRLRTTFFRSRRSILERFLVDDVLELRKAFSGVIGHKFNIDDPLDYAAFLNLAQHHGYPTPLLDWTLSPYVAAFFAFRNIRGRNPRPGKVRIFKFASFQWNSIVPQFQTVFPALPHVSMLDALAIGNPRAIPQQALSMIANVDDIESHIASVEQSRQLTFLEAIDLPASARAEVMRDLAFMGITAASLFPGLDGVCESLREKNFS
jgi:hypothetical protein